MITFREEMNSVPPYIIGTKFSEQLEKYGITRVAKLNSNEPAFGPFPDAIKAMKDAILHFNKLPEDGSPELKDKLSKKFGIPMKNICVSAGSWEVLRLLALAAIERGDEVIMGWPTWPPAKKETQVMGCACIKVPLLYYVYDLPQILERITTRTKMIYICNPNNPTGTVVTKKQLDDFFSKVPDNVVTVVDEAYAEYNYNPEYCSAIEYLNSSKPLLVLRTFSKIFGLISGRIGYGIGSTEIIQNLEKCRPPMNINLAAEIAATVSLDDVETLIQRAKHNFEQREYLHGEFKKMGLEYTPSEANFVFVNVQHDSMDIWAKLIAFGVLVRPGKTYECPTWLRVSIGLPEENKIFIDALKKVLVQ